MPMKVSIAMCTYNGARYLQEQLDSLASQTYLPFELIVCDDRSTDKTMEIVSRFSETAPFPVHLTQNRENLGSTQNFSRAIISCSGDLIALCDQDDVWNPDKIKKQVQVFEQDLTVEGVFCDGELIDSNSSPLNKSLWDSVSFSSSMRRQVRDGKAVSAMLRQNFVTGATLMFKSGFRPSFLPIPGEWIHDAWIAWMIALHSKLYLLSDRLINYRIHADQQIGADLQSLQDRLGRNKKQVINEHAINLKRLNSLELRMTEDAPENGTAYLKLVRNKKDFLEVRIALLQMSRLLRAVRLTTKIAGYMRFAKGVRSIIGDLFL
jgi:glycosyltransferase involved in cell wall biosynthesis